MRERDAAGGAAEDGEDAGAEGRAEEVVPLCTNHGNNECERIYNNSE